MRNGGSRINSLRNLLWLQHCAQGQPELQESLSQEVNEDAGVLSGESLLFRKRCVVFFWMDGFLCTGLFGYEGNICIFFMGSFQHI